MNSKKKPEIRFKGFADYWTLYRIGELGSIIMNKRIYKEQTAEEGDIPFYKIGTFGGTADAFITEKLFNEYKSKYPYPEKGNILLSASGSIGKTVEYNGEDAYFQDSNIIWLKHNKKITDPFLKHIYDVCKWDGLEGSTIKRLYNRNILNTEINIPLVKEQNKISDLLDNIDKLIKLNQNKCDKLISFKKSMFEKMFPIESSLVPEIRFKNYNGCWKKVTYEELGSPLSGGNLSYESLNDDGDKNCILYGDLYTKYDCVIRNIKNKTFMKGNTVIKNDILFPQSTTVDAYSLISPACLNESVSETSGVFVIRPNSDVNGNFVCYFSKGNEHQRIKLSKNAQGLTIVHLYYQSIKDETIAIPSLSEQETISELFLKIDDLINLQKQKLEKLNNIKLTMLEKILV